MQTKKGKRTEVEQIKKYSEDQKDNIERFLDNLYKYRENTFDISIAAKKYIEHGSEEAFIIDEELEDAMIHIFKDFKNEELINNVIQYLNAMLVVYRGILSFDEVKKEADKKDIKIKESFK